MASLRQVQAVCAVCQTLAPTYVKAITQAYKKTPQGGRTHLHDELAAPHSITSSARASSMGGISRPIARAVGRLMTNSNLVERITGRSAGLAPLRSLPV